MRTKTKRAVHMELSNTQAMERLEAFKRYLAEGGNTKGEVKQYNQTIYYLEGLLQDRKVLPKPPTLKVASPPSAPLDVEILEDQHTAKWVGTTPIRSKWAQDCRACGKQMQDQMVTKAHFITAGGARSGEVWIHAECVTEFE